MASAPPRVIVCKDATVLAQTAARRIAELSGEAIASRGRFTIALAGGSTPAQTYLHLATLELDWEHWQFYFSDERCVPPSHRDSNFAMAERTLLSALPISPVQVWRMEGEAEDSEAAALRYEALLPQPLDLVLLGMGEDGHTASLFPGSSVLFDTERRVVAVVGTKPPPLRLTITPLVIASARETMVLVSGAGKAKMVAEALQGALRTRDIPVQCARRAIWMLDEDAASMLNVIEIKEET